MLIKMPTVSVPTLGQIHCSLAMAKSRVAPLRPVKIPRLELTAALVSVKISDVLHQELDGQQSRYWVHL